MTVQDSHQFFRPILWDNHNEEFKYSKGGTINIIQYEGSYLVITAEHVLTQPGRDWKDAVVLHRANSQWRISLGTGAFFTPKKEDEEDTEHHDVQIHEIVSFPDQEPPLQPGEYLEVGAHPAGIDPYRRLYLSGFADQDNLIDYENEISSGDGTTIEGYYGGPAKNCHGIGLFKSPELIGTDVNGMSGGAITSFVDGKTHLEGILVRGAGSLENDFVRFVERSVLDEMLRQSISKFKNACSE